MENIFRFVIYIKAGAYFENVEVDSKKPMIMFLGDGIGKTWIKGNRSVVDGWTTFRSATVGEFNSPIVFRPPCSCIQDFSFEII